ncbi:hypothetical protein Ctob_012137 [Chrysochromulina tobinii]|uniref:EF-hand domain-containing protein n=1 Tax=Chrysochromulina tobinii TaxID=1460289 RepID=A0A0M0LQ08_9EUKA|nr:hypothetical protein Ctob_012137 [Chrysochromulina tobinii]|eukprot:KOO53076.1 hypothetical protein Ctob_012137 [Chrysochromulina sp. CCMP291]
MIEEAFRLIDKNGDGVLSRTEVIKAVRTNQSVRNILGLGGVVRQGACRFESRTREQFEAIFERLDADKSKTVSLDEFMRALLPTEPEAPPAPRGLTADAELISFTLDDMPVFVRTILSGGNSSAANWYQVVDALKGAGVMVPEPLVASVVMLPTPAVGVSRRGMVIGGL